MEVSPDQWQRVIDAIQSRRLRLETPTAMFAGRGTGRLCDGCCEIIDPTQVEYENMYQDGFSHYLHLGCAGILDAEQRRAAKMQERAANEPQARKEAHSLRLQSWSSRDQARDAAKESRQIRDLAGVLRAEARVRLAEASKIARGKHLVSPGGPAPVLQGTRVLLVEDHDDTREVLTRLLAMHGALVVMKQ